MIKIKTNIKSHGKETRLWYYKHQKQTFELAFESKEGFFVKRPDVSSKLWLVKKKHGEFLETSVDDMV